VTVLQSPTRPRPHITVLTDRDGVRIVQYTGIVQVYRYVEQSASKAVA